MVSGYFFNISILGMINGLYAFRFYCWGAGFVAFYRLFYKFSNSSLLIFYIDLYFAYIWGEQNDVGVKVNWGSCV